MKKLISNTNRYLIAWALSLTLACPQAPVWGSACGCHPVSNPETTSGESCCSGDSYAGDALGSDASKACCSESNSCCCDSFPLSSIPNSGFKVGCKCDDLPPKVQKNHSATQTEHENKKLVVFFSECPVLRGSPPESEFLIRDLTESGNRFTTSAQLCALLSRFTC